MWRLVRNWRGAHRRQKWFRTLPAPFLWQYAWTKAIYLIRDFVQQGAAQSAEPWKQRSGGPAILVDWANRPISLLHHRPGPEPAASTRTPLHPLLVLGLQTFNTRVNRQVNPTQPDSAPPTDQIVVDYGLIHSLLLRGLGAWLDHRRLRLKYVPPRQYAFHQRPHAQLATTPIYSRLGIPCILEPYE